MKLCGFEVGLEHPLFVIAGEYRSAEQGPLGDATAEVLMRGPHR